ncbi:MAG: hypothetical protein LBQ73_04695, partial [Tannerellaceae bacterium]|nr:hypothetical protein [Tannerellaceae bacterium]
FQDYNNPRVRKVFDRKFLIFVGFSLCTSGFMFVSSLDIIPETNNILKLTVPHILTLAVSIIVAIIYKIQILKNIIL